MPYICSVPDCKNRKKYASNKCSMFSYPKEEERKEAWLAAIQRPNWEPNYKNSRVCDIHFKKEDILWVNVFHDSVTGITHSVPAKRPRLTTTAVPSIFPGQPDPAKRKRTRTASPAINNSPVAKRKKNREESITAPSMSSLPSPDEVTAHHIPGCPLYHPELDSIDLHKPFSSLHALKACNAKFAPPEPWHLIEKPNSSIYLNVEEAPVPSVTHMVSCNADLQLSLYIDNLEVVGMGARTFPCRVNNVKSIHDILNEFQTFEKIGDVVGKTSTQMLKT